MGLNQKLRYISLLFCLFLIVSAGAQAIPSGNNGERLLSQAINEQLLRSQVGFLTDPLCEGRATGTRGTVEAGAWIARQFSSYGLLPLAQEHFHSFIAEDKIGRNILGFSPSSYPSGKYIVIAAHYDNIGVLNGNIYPGADSNASGVAALLALARLNRGSMAMGQLSTCNIIFAALDAKQLSYAGAEALYASIAEGRLRDPKTGVVITPDRISLLVNLDTIGSSLEPVHKARKDFIIMLGGNDAENNALNLANYSSGAMLDLCYDYYGSKDFTDLFLNRLGDQKVFLSHKVHSVLFTSGITMNTNKLEDTEDSLDYPILRRRILLIYNWLNRILS